LNSLILASSAAHADAGATSKVAKWVIWKISGIGRKIGVIANQSVIELTIYIRFASRFFPQLPV
jgi:hypothetical protein